MVMIKTGKGKGATAVSLSRFFMLSGHYWRGETDFITSWPVIQEITEEMFYDSGVA